MDYTYDEIGNPLSYYNGTTYIMDWTDGRRLRQLMDDKNFYTYEYNLNGIRTKKTGPEGTTEYIIIDGKAMGERVRDANGTYKYNLRYLFDETGSVCGFSRNNFGENFWVNYYFSKNLQGDVTAIYRADSTGFGLVATYTYDSWGNVISKTGNFADINPFRYRGYYQDNESGFYYLQSRYYDPSIGRFINADSFASTGQGFLGYNMFAYCMNNPINASDPNGEIAITTAIMIGAAIIGAISAGYTAYKEYQAGMGTGRIIGDSACAGFLGFSIVYTGGMSLYQCYQNYCYLNAMVPATDVSINMSQANTVDLYRAVSLEEYNSSVATQKFAAGPNSYADEKFFATTYEDPVTWGSKMYGTVPFEVIHGTFEAQLVSSAVAQYWERLDGIGPAFLIPIEALNRWVISIN